MVISSDQTTESDESISETTPPPRRATSTLREIIETALLALLIFVLVRTFVLNFKVDGRSMLPTFENGEMLLVNRNAYRAIDAWDFIDIIVFTPPAPGEDKPYIKRVIGVPGDTIEIGADARVHVNGTPIEEDYIRSDGTVCPTGAEYCGPLTVPEGSVYVMGDNRNNSEDSRYFGVVPEENIIGKAWVVYWPSDVWGPVEHPDYPELAS
jgi:signal peptidase I